MITVQSEVRCYEVEGEEVRDLKPLQIRVRSHWNRSEMVTLMWTDGKAVTVLGQDLIAAIQNAQSTGKR